MLEVLWYKKDFLMHEWFLHAELSGRILILVSG